MRTSLRSSFIALCMVVMAGCGFQLRGAYSFPYESIFVSGPDYSLVVASLKRAIRGSGSARLAEKAEDAQAIFLPTSEAKEPIILSLSGSGRVRDKRLRYRYGYRIVDAKGRDLVLPGPANARNATRHLHPLLPEPWFVAGIRSSEVAHGQRRQP